MTARDASVVTDFSKIRHYWAPRARPELIRRLYESDAAGLLDGELVDEVGYALLLRCKTIQCVTERRCPECHERMQGAFDNARAIER